MSKPFQYGFNLANGASGFRTVTNSAMFSAFEIQFGVDDCLRDRSGVAFTADGAVGDYLRAAGVDVVHYVCPFYSHDVKFIGLPARRGPGRDPYFPRLEVAEAADKYGWWLTCADGERPTGFKHSGEPLYALDVGNKDFRDWYVSLVTRNRGKRRTLRFDCGWDGSQYPIYLKCAISGLDDLTAGQYALFDALRSEGWRVVVNAAWNMSNPDAPASEWVYPAMGHVDGVMLELAGDVKAGGHWFGVWREEIRRAVASSWLAAGKVVIVAAKYDARDARRFGAFSDFSAFERYHLAEAQQLGYRVGIADGAAGGVSIWMPDYGVEKPAPLWSDSSGGEDMKHFKIVLHDDGQLVIVTADGSSVGIGELLRVVDGAKRLLLQNVKVGSVVDDCKEVQHDSPAEL